MLHSTLENNFLFFFYIVKLSESKKCLKIYYLKINKLLQGPKISQNDQIAIYKNPKIS